MNREEMFALAHGQSDCLTEMKEKHCIDSWDLFTGEEMYDFIMFVMLETSELDQSIYSTVHKASLKHRHDENYQGVQGYLSGNGWRSSSGSYDCH